MPSSRGSSRPRDRICVSYVSCIGRQVLYHWCHLGSQINTQIKINIKRKKNRLSQLLQIFVDSFAAQPHHGLLWFANTGDILMLLGWVNVVMSCTQPLWKVNIFISSGLCGGPGGVGGALDVLSGCSARCTTCCWRCPRTRRLPEPSASSLYLWSRSACWSTSWEPSAPPAWRTRIPRLVWCSSSRSSLSSQWS